MSKYFEIFRRARPGYVFALSMALVAGSVSVRAQTTTYAIQTQNFNAQQTRVPSGGYAGSFNNGSTEVGLYANGGSGGTNETAFETFSTTGTTSGSARPLQVGDNFNITLYSGSSPYGFAGVYFDANTTYASYANYNTNERTAVVLGSSGDWMIDNGGSSVDTGIGAGTSLSVGLSLTSSNTFNMTITNNTSGVSTTYYDLVELNSGSISSFALALQNDSGSDFYVKNGSLTGTGSVVIGGSNLTLTNSGNITDGLTSNSTSTVTVNSLSKIGTGTETLTGTNTFSGTTAINNGTLALGANGSLGGGQTSYTSAVSVNSGGTLLLSNASATDRINDATGVTLNGGAFNTAGFSERVGALTLASTSTVDLGNGTSTLIFGGTSSRTGGNLAFSDWTLGSDHIFFYSSSSSLTAYAVPFLSNITINGSAVMELATGEIVPVPEPATWMAGFLAVGTLMGSAYRRRSC